jgi:hypothetical protein
MGGSHRGTNYVQEKSLLELVHTGTGPPSAAYDFISIVLEYSIFRCQCVAMLGSVFLIR